MHIVNPPAAAGRRTRSRRTPTSSSRARPPRPAELRSMIFWALTQGNGKSRPEARLRAEVPAAGPRRRREGDEGDRLPVERLRLGRVGPEPPSGVTSDRAPPGALSRLRICAVSEAVRDLIEAYDAAWNRQDLDALCALHADDVVFENHTAGERAEGADAVRAHIGGIFERWPSLRFRGRSLSPPTTSRSASGPRPPRVRTARRSSGTASTSSRCRTGRSPARTSIPTSHAPRVVC